MSRDADKIVNDAMNMGYANLKIIELARRYCQDMQFVPTGGSGWVEAETGLPIGMRRIKCPVANGSGEAMNLEWVASDFYKENCIKCHQRRPTILLPNLGTYFEQQQNDGAIQYAKNENRLAEMHQAWETRRQHRESVAITATQAMVSALSDINILDGDPTLRQETKDLESAERRLSALAENAPLLFTENVVTLALSLVSEVNIDRLLTPLRHLATSRSEFAPKVCSVALQVLSADAIASAGHCLVDLASHVNVKEINDLVVKSLIWLAGSPNEDDFGDPRHLKSANDPSGLRVLADLDPARVARVLERMLPKPVNAEQLILPSGSQKQEDTETDYNYASAAGAIRELAITHPSIVENLVPHLLRSLSIQSFDKFGIHPDAAGVRTLATLAVLNIGDVLPQIEKNGKYAGKEFREAMLEVLEKVVRLLDPHNRRRDAGDPLPDISRREQLFDQIFTSSMLRLEGDWGDDHRIVASQLIEDLSEVDPIKAFSNLSSLLGALVLLSQEIDKKPNPSPLVSTPRPETLLALEEIGRRQGIFTSSSNLAKAVVSAAEVDPAVTSQTIVDLIHEERKLGRNRDPRSELIGLLGKIGRNHGNEFKVLQLILPILHSYIVDNVVQNRSSALDAWCDIAQSHELPSSLNGLLPALLSDRYLVVIRSILRLARSLPWSEVEKKLLLSYARDILESESHGETLKEAIYTSLSLARRSENLLPIVESEVLKAAVKLDRYDLRRVLQSTWLSSSRGSQDMALLRLRQAADPTINDRLNSNESEQLNSLLECGAGLTLLPLSEFLNAALEYAPDYPLASSEFVEVTWRANRLEDAKSITERVLSEIPELPSYALQRRLAAFIDANVAVDLSADLDSSWDSAMEHLADVMDSFRGDDQPWVQNLLWQARIRATVRHLLAARIPDSRLSRTGVLSGVENTAESTTNLQSRADQLTSVLAELLSRSDATTQTGAYIHGFAKFCEIGVQLLRFKEAILDADVEAINAISIAVRKKAALLTEELSTVFRSDDPLAKLLTEDLTKIAEVKEYDHVEPILARLASLPLPLLIIRGKKINRRFTPTSLSEDADISEASSSVAVVLASIDGKLVTGPEILRPNRVYQLSVEIFTDPWPEWATQLDIELLSALSDSELTRPTFIWRRRDEQTDSNAIGSNSFEQSGTLIVRFTLAGGMSAQPLLIRANWRGERDGHPFSQKLEVTGHHELKVRPFDSSTDFLTDHPVFDERLLELYTRLNSSNYDVDQVQAFCRLFTSICRVGLRMTWDKEYKRGKYVTERQFHDEFHRRLLEESELEGRVERGQPLALGFLDVRHDGITAELKVERRTPVSKESAAKYIGQPTQYAVADGSRISILAVLDMSPKEQPVGTSENYLFFLQPKLHGLLNPEAPSLVACLIINGNLPTPSSWSRKRISLDE